MTDPALAALLAAAALHLGFQLTVTVVVYPALARVGEPAWRSAHAAHSRAITPVVALAYGSLLVSTGWALVTASGAVLPWVVATAAGAALCVLATALVAAPTHSRLADGPDPRLLRRLLRVDRVRLVGAAACLVGAAGAALAA